MNQMPGHDVMPMQRPVPVVHGPIMHTLLTAVICAVAGTAMCIAGIIFLLKPESGFGGFGLATLVAVVGAMSAVILLPGIVGKSVDRALSVVMLTAGVRVTVSALGAVTAVRGLGAPLESTAMMICGYYVATLLAESVVVSRAMGRATVQMRAG
jgi:hypothetical protein